MWLTHVVRGVVGGRCDSNKAGKLNKDQLVTMFGLMSLAQQGQTPDVGALSASTPPPKIDGLVVPMPTPVQVWPPQRSLVHWTIGPTHAWWRGCCKYASMIEREHSGGTAAKGGGVVATLYGLHI